MSDGRAALEAARADPPDLVLADVMMPGLDGTALVAALARRSRDGVRAVHAALGPRRAGGHVGWIGGWGRRYLVKPLSGAELRARVRAHLDLGRSRSGESPRMRELARAVAHINDAGNVAEALARLTRAARELPGAHEAVAGTQPCRLGRLAVPLTAADGAGLELGAGVDRGGHPGRRGRARAAHRDRHRAREAGAAAPVDRGGAHAERSILGPAELPAPFAARYEPAVGGLAVGGDGRAPCIADQEFTHDREEVAFDPPSPGNSRAGHAGICRSR